MGSYTYDTYSAPSSQQSTMYRGKEIKMDEPSNLRINGILENIKESLDVFPAIPQLVVCLIFTVVYIYIFCAGKRKNRKVASSLLSSIYPNAGNFYHRIGSNITQATSHTMRELEIFDKQQDMDQNDQLVYLHEAGEKEVQKYLTLLQRNIQRYCKYAYGVKSNLHCTDFTNSEKYSQYLQISSSILEQFSNVYISAYSGDDSNITMSMLCSLVTSPRNNLLAPLHHFVENKFKQNADDVLNCVFPLEVAVSNPLLWVYTCTGDEAKMYKQYPDVDNLFGVDPTCYKKYYSEDEHLPKLIYNTWAHSAEEKQLVSEEQLKRMHSIYTLTSGAIRQLSIYITDCGDDLQLLYGPVCDFFEKPTDYQNLVGGKVGKCGVCVRVRWQFDKNINWSSIEKDIWTDKQEEDLSKYVAIVGHLSYRCAKEIGNLSIKPQVAKRNIEMRQKLFDQLDRKE